MVPPLIIGGLTAFGLWEAKRHAQRLARKRSGIAPSSLIDLPLAFEYPSQPPIFWVLRRPIESAVCVRLNVDAIVTTILTALRHNNAMIGAEVRA
ncbi:hypothetical protein [Sphingobium sp. CAP-1]|uniref:hypothetical protein n=1 Tax=Sphingobium sp. CAP-1 TaxID=2676077 RepID=UPI0012BB3535|nr:hypothetical protein [Sphingobium sp. CAP-1]QGP78704.1 hypothetical protein GL174_06655 [Sphingobium sp. CAP-1]